MMPVFVMTFQDVVGLVIVVLILILYSAIYVERKYKQFRCKHENTRLIVGGKRCLVCGKEFLK